MSIYTPSNVTGIYWAYNDGFKRGRDPLGIQNSSVATYSNLLPGMTNLTGHIRYYSLYCWLLNEYDKLDKANLTKINQYNFIRRAELALALIMKDFKLGSVVGSLFVAQDKCIISEDGYYNLAQGADYESKEKYWTYQTGAFGQYYLGSLIYFDLVKIEEKRFYLRDEGKKLAEAFRNSVDKEVQDLFIECLIDGEIGKEEISFLTPLRLNKIEKESPEWDSLNKLLTKKDGNSSLRRETLLLFLKDFKQGIDKEEFVRYRFLNVDISDLECQAVFGWYFYFLCEVLHYALETIFCLFLNRIKELGNPTVWELLNNLKEGIKEENSKIQIYKSVEEWKNEIDLDINSGFDDLKEEIRNQNYVKGAYRSFILLLRLYDELEVNKELILKFEKDNDLLKQRGIFSRTLEEYVGRNLDTTIDNFIEIVFTRIMQEHSYVALNKMGKSNVDLRKFLIEDGRINLVEIRYPTQTSPRINSLYNFLKDMNYITNENTLSEIAENYIANYGKE